MSARFQRHIRMWFWKNTRLCLINIHLLISLSDGAAGSPRPTQRIPRIVSALKRLTNSSTGEKLWQVSYYDHVVRNEEDFLRIWEYIDTNPTRWAEDEYHI